MEHPPKPLSQIPLSYLSPRCWNWRRIIKRDVGLNYIWPPPSIHLSVVKCVPSPQAEKDDWKRTVTFYTFTKIGDKSYKVIMNNKSCINAISFKLCKNLELEIIPHLHRFKMLGLMSQHLRSNNDVLFQSVSIIIKTRFGVMWSSWMWVKLY